MTREEQFPRHIRRAIEAVSDAKLMAPSTRVEEHLEKMEHQLHLLLIMADGFVRARQYEGPAVQIGMEGCEA